MVMPKANFRNHSITSVVLRYGLNRFFPAFSTSMAPDLCQSVGLCRAPNQPGNPPKTIRRNRAFHCTGSAAIVGRRVSEQHFAAPFDHAETTHYAKPSNRFLAIRSASQRSINIPSGKKSPSVQPIDLSSRLVAQTTGCSGNWSPSQPVTPRKRVSDAAEQPNTTLSRTCDSTEWQ